MSAKPLQRNPPWTRDELILALDFYFSHRRTVPDKRSEDIAALSREINATAHRLGLTGSETLRNRNGVYMKLMNFRSHDPQFTGRGRKGLSRGNKDETVVWDQFADDLHRLREVADAIRARLAEEPGGEEKVEEFDEPEVAEAEEGRLVTQVDDQSPVEGLSFGQIIDHHRKQLARDLGVDPAAVRISIEVS